MSFSFHVNHTRLNPKLILLMGVNHRQHMKPCRGKIRKTDQSHFSITLSRVLYFMKPGKWSETSNKYTTAYSADITTHYTRIEPITKDVYLCLLSTI